MITGPMPSKGTPRRAAAVDALEPTVAAAALTKAAARDEIVLTALARGATYAEAGKAAKSSERTVRRRMSDPKFVAELGRRRGAYISAVTGALVSKSSRAVEVIAECLEDADKTSDRLKAAQLMLAMARQYHSDTDVDARLVALEATAAGVQPDNAADDPDNEENEADSEDGTPGDDAAEATDD